MAPAELLDDHIAIEKNFANMDGMVSSNLIIRHTLIFTRILIFEKTSIQLILERGEIDSCKLVVSFLCTYILFVIF